MPGPAQVGDRGTVAQSMFDRSYSMMAPAIEKANSTLLGNLQARGIPIGATAFNDAYGAQQQQTQDTISRLAMSADAAAGQEQSRQFGLDSAARSSSLSEIMQAMGGAFLPASSTPSGNVQGVNYSGLVNDAYNTNQANQAATMSTLGSLGGALLMKCAVAAKDAKGAVSIHDVAEGLMSLPLHHWAYKPEFAPPGHGTEDHLGPMAGDFQETFGLGDGQNIMVVDAFGVLFAALKSALQRIDILERDHYGVEIH